MDPIFLFLFTKVASLETFFILSAFLLLWLYLQKRTRSAVLFFGTCTALMTSVTFLKNLIEMPRPLGPLIAVTGYGFPSGHAAGVMFLGLLFSFLQKENARHIRYSVYIFSFLVVAAVGISRVYLHVHTPLQILAGYALGILWASMWFLLEQRNKLHIL